MTENISEFVDIWLQPLMRDLPSFIKDTEFIRLIENTPLPDKCILASIDVSSSLYTNIPHHEGKQAAMKALSSLENPDARQPPADVIGKLIDIVLKKYCL